MTRAKRTPEERAAAKQKADERAEVSVRRMAAKASFWPGFPEFMAAYAADAPAVDALHEAIAVMMARGAWESGRPSPRMRGAITAVLQRFPAVTIDPKSGRRQLAGEWLMKLWPGPAPEELRAMLDDSGAWYDAQKAKKAADAAHGIEPGMPELAAMVEAAQFRESRYWPERDDSHVEEWPRLRPCR
jgi:hypothetical protein